MLDTQGYLTLTGRIKELINRGGEKISPLEVDGVLLSHPSVAEAVSFGAPDDKYGEVVAAAVVLRQGCQVQGAEASIREHTAKRLAAFKVPTQIFITDVLPKTATGKIQRRHMVAAFIKPGGAGGGAGGGSKAAGQAGTPTPGVAGVGDGYQLVAGALARLGVKLAYGVVGIPVTPLASALQAAGVRFIGMRNEQAAGYAAAAAGFLTGVPAVFLTVSGPGAVHGVAGVSHASINCFPLLMLAGSAEKSEVGKGAFQELDQPATLSPFCKGVFKPDRFEDVSGMLRQAYDLSVTGRPGPVYIDLGGDLLLARLPAGVQALPALLAGAAPPARTPALSAPDAGAVQQAVRLLSAAKRPLLVVGKGAALARAESQVQHLVNRFGLPVLCTSMGRGLVPDTHPCCVNAARSTALRDADVAVVVGARLNWQLHFGEPPRWARDVRFILIDIAPSPRDASMAAAVLASDARVGLSHLSDALSKQAWDSTRLAGWSQELSKVSKAAAVKLAKRIASAPAHPLDYHASLGAVSRFLSKVQPPAVVVSEGANTMDMARLMLPVIAPRTRIDAGTWGTMGVGLGAAIAAATTGAPDQLVVAIEGDSAFGFSGMELEVMCRYKLPILVIVMNNGGIYGGDRREDQLRAAAADGARQAGFGHDPAPTAFVPNTRYDLLMDAFGGSSWRVSSLADLEAALLQARSHLPALIDLVLDPMAGVESGNVHAFNAPKPKL